MALIIHIKNCYDCPFLNNGELDFECNCPTNKVESYQIPLDETGPIPINCPLLKYEILIKIKPNDNEQYIKIHPTIVC